MSQSCNEIINVLVIVVACFRFFVSPLLFIFGLSANILAFYIFFTNRPRTRYSLYPMALSISESLVLLLNAFIDDFLGRGLNYFTNGRLNLKLDTASTAACQFTEFSELWNSFVTAYILLAFGLDRVLSISFPHRFQKDRHIWTTVCTFVGIMLAGACMCGPIASEFVVYSEEHVTMAPLVYTESSQNRTEVCSVRPYEESLSRRYYTKIHVTIATYLIPNFLLVIMNCIIIWQITVFLRRRRQRLLSMQRRRSSTGVDQGAERKIEMKRVFAYLFISFVSLVFTVPLAVAICIRSGQSSSASHCEFGIVAELTRLFNSMKDIQFACHGYTYIFFFKFYRQRVKEIVDNLVRLCCGCCLPKGKSTQEINKDTPGALISLDCVTDDAQRSLRSMS